jgi:hypothetical protein
MSHKQVQNWKRSFAPGDSTSRAKTPPRAEQLTVADADGASANRRSRSAALGAARQKQPPAPFRAEG